MKKCPFNPEVTCQHHKCFSDCVYFDKRKTLDAFQGKVEKRVERVYFEAGV